VERAEHALGGRPAHVAVVHADASQEAEALARTLAERCHCLELLLAEFTPVMGASTGPGLLGVVFYPVDHAVA
jgi:fatty acid-binding protein DegV